jgi:MFS family permease
MALALIAVAIRLLIYKQIDKISSKVLFLIALSAIFLAMFLLLFLNSFLFLFIIGLIYGTGHSILFPTLSTSFVKYAKEKEKVIFNNIFLAYYIAGQLIFPSIMGLGGDLLAIDAIFSFMSIVLFSGIIINLYSFIYSK